jgi:glycerophosphoryl diester phosphodiesterase
MTETVSPRPRRRRFLLAGLGALLVLLYLLNASWLAPAPRGRPIVIAHRGVYQQFNHVGLGLYGCTANRIFKPVHPFLENTIPSMREAFRLGADIVELDVAPTADGDVMVFHDWFLDCRTNGHGEIRTHKVAELKALDIGYNYTADGGRTFPFRGRGIGMMPTLEEVLHAFPNGRFLINFKSKDPNEADAVAAAFRRAGIAIDDKYSFYGGGIDRVLARMRRYAPRSWMFDQAGIKRCALGYLLRGWTGLVPAACRDGTIVVPINYRGLAWGWPNRFLARMEGAGTHVMLWGDAHNLKAPEGIERPDQLAKVPPGFSGYLWIEDIYAVRGPLHPPAGR